MDSANAPNNISEQSPHPSSDALAPSDRHERRLDPNGEAEPRHRAKRRPSGQQRICGKCQKSLTGQFVRALGDTYHLECFTCNVCSPSVSHSSFVRTSNAFFRTAARLSPRNSSQYPIIHRINIHSARPTIFGGWICSATPVAVLCADLTSLRWIANIISNTSHAVCVRQYSAHQTATTSTMAACIATTTTLLDLRRSATAARRPSLSNSSRSSETASTSIGIQNAT